MSRLVTVGIPVYRRLDYLPLAVRSVALQDYAQVELIVSDNGMNGRAVPEIVDAHYPKPWRFRQNPTTVESAEHFNQIIAAASGEYFTLLADDDEIGPTFVSELAALLDRHPGAGLALSAQEVVDKAGCVLARSHHPLPETITGADLIRAVWRTHEYGFHCLVTHLARTSDLRRVGGFPHFSGATHDDDAVLILLVLGRLVALSDRCTFRWRKYGESLGWSISIDELAAASREFLEFLDRDETIQRFAKSHPSEWREAHETISAMVYDTYLTRWRELYRKRMPAARWMAAAFAMPKTWAYYRLLASMLTSMARLGSRRLLDRWLASGNRSVDGKASR